MVGAAPSRAAAATGHYYAGKRNRFWQVLAQRGLTPRELLPSEDWTVLKYGIGLMAMLPSEISTSNALLRKPKIEERERVRAAIVEYGPEVVLFNGADVFTMFAQRPPERWGLQPGNLGTSLQFVAHSSSGRADRWSADRLFLYRELAALLGPDPSAQCPDETGASLPP